MRFNPHAFKRTQGSTGDSPVPSGNLPDGTCETIASPVVEEQSKTLTAFILHYGRPNVDKVVVPEHSLAVTLAMKFNDSAPQVDYWNHHAHLGCPDFLLLVVRKQARTEHLARQALALCPELQRLDWKWHKDNYRGGNGTYLGSSAFPLPPALREAVTARTTWGAQPVSTVFWEIEFSSGESGDRLQLFPHRHFGERPPGGIGDPPVGPTGPITVAWRQNHRLNGVEIHFSRRPDDDALTPIRNARHNGDRWRYNGHDRCWWIRQCPEAIAFATQFCEHFARGGTGDSPVPSGNLPDGTCATITSTCGTEADPITIVSALRTPHSALQRPPRKIIHFCQPEVPPATPLSSVASAQEEAAERKDLERKLLAQQARAEFYEATPIPACQAEAGRRLVDVVALMRPKGILIN